VRADFSNGPASGYAQHLLDANAEFVGFVEACSDDDWRRVCSVEGWPVGVVAHHIAWGHERQIGWIITICDGFDVHGSPEHHEASNAARALEAARVSRHDVIELAGRNAERLAQLLRSLTVEDLEMCARFGPAGGLEMSVDRLARNTGHLTAHLDSMRDALGR